MLSKVSLPAETWAFRFSDRRNQLGVALQRDHYQLGSTHPDTTYSYRPLQLIGDQINLLEPEPQQLRSHWNGGWGAESDVDDSVGYYSDSTYDSDGNSTTFLKVVRRSLRDDQSVLAPILLWKLPARSGNSSASLFVVDHKLYVAGRRSIVFEITDPLQPTRLIDRPDQWQRNWNNWEIAPVARFLLPPAPGLSPVQRLQFLMRADRGNFRSATLFEGSLSIRQLGEPYAWTLTVYRLQTLTDTEAVFDLLFKREPTLIQHLFGPSIIEDMTITHGLLYTASASGMVSVYDLNGPPPLRLIAHFVASGHLDTLRPLPDGRVLVGGQAIYLLGPPPRH